MFVRRYCVCRMPAFSVLCSHWHCPVYREISESLLLRDRCVPYVAFAEVHPDGTSRRRRTWMRIRATEIIWLHGSGAVREKDRRKGISGEWRVEKCKR